MKMPRRRLAPLTRSLALAAVLLLVTGTGCTAATMAAHSGPHNVSIVFKPDRANGRDCPSEVLVDPVKQCPEWFWKKKDCLHSSPGAKVIFTAEMAEPPAGSGDLEFSLDFDPFKTGSNQFKGKKGQALELQLDPRSPPKAYTYNVFSPKCPVLDPQIIIR
jgi:hypothetical protein